MNGVVSHGDGSGELRAGERRAGDSSLTGTPERRTPRPSWGFALAFGAASPEGAISGRDRLARTVPAHLARGTARQPRRKPCGGGIYTHQAIAAKPLAAAI